MTLSTDAYYYYPYPGQDDMAEFGYFYIEPYRDGGKIFRCKTHWFFGFNSFISDPKTGIMSSNQLHGQNGVRNVYELWYLSLDDIEDKHRLISTIFSSRIELIKEVK